MFVLSFVWAFCFRFSHLVQMSFSVVHAVVCMCVCVFQLYMRVTHCTAASRSLLFGFYLVFGHWYIYMRVCNAFKLFEFFFVKSNVTSRDYAFLWLLLQPKSTSLELIKYFSNKS